MNSCRWELYKYSLPLKNPLRMLGRTLKLRKGLILRLYDQAGNFSEGEIIELNNQAYHEVVNNWDQDRIHFIFDKQSEKFLIGHCGNHLQIN